MQHTRGLCVHLLGKTDLLRTAQCTWFNEHNDDDDHVDDGDDDNDDDITFNIFS